MIGNEVTVRLHSPDQEVHGTLNQQNANGVYVIQHYGLDHAGQKFYPTHRIVEITDRGYRPR